jgi:glycosyltransferase involved in cell wall biosynthesis
MTISLILPYFERAHLMPAVFESIKRNTVQPDEVIVVDDGSKTDCEELTKSYGFKYIKLPQKEEYNNSSIAYNAGIRAATMDACVLCSAELIHGPRNFEIIKEVINDEMLFIGSCVYFQGRLAELSEDSISKPETIEQQHNILLFDQDGDPDNFIIRHDNMDSAIHVISKSNLIKVNGYDEELTSWGHNDADMKRRLKRLGLYTVKSNDVFSIHQYHERAPQYNVINATKDRLKAEQREGIQCKVGLIKI